jgi:GntR family transcriptional regulator
MAWDSEDLVHGAMPLWAQIADRLRSSIDSGEFIEGQDLPSEAQIIRRFNISRATARNAMGQLAAEGLVVRRSGKGTTVLPSRVEQPLNLLSSFTEDMNSRGLTPGYGEITVMIDALEQRVADVFGVETCTPAVRIERLLLANGFAIAHSVSWLAPAFVPPEAIPAGETLESSSLYVWLERAHGLRISNGTEVIEARVADAHLAQQLNIAAGSPVLNATRTARTSDGNAIEFAERQYRADRYRYRIELVRP